MNLYRWPWIALLSVLGVPAMAAAEPCSALAPITCFTSPAPGAVLSGTVTLEATSSGSGDRVFRIDGEYIAAEMSRPYSLLVDTTRFVDGPHILTIEAYPGAVHSGGLQSAVSMAVTLANGVTSRPSPPTGFLPRSAASNGSDPIVVAAVGDGPDGRAGAAAVTSLIDGWNPQMLLFLGDTYQSGSEFEFENYWGRSASSPFFGRFRDITNPSIGNHEYLSNLAGYLWYWDSPPKWYATDAGAWKIIALDSNCKHAGGCAPGSPQYDWLSSTLAAASDQCVIVMEHHPRVSTSSHGDTAAMDPFWRLMAQYGVELNLVGHEHNYQRWQPLDADLAVAEGGVTEFVVGTGGHGSSALDVRIDTRRVTGSTSYGALRLKLYPAWAEYEFITTAGTVIDSGSVPCHGSGTGDVQAPSVPDGVAAATSGTSATVTWAASTDNVGVTAYQVHRDGVQVATVAVASLSYTDTTLAPETSYSFTVRALDAAGNVSALSAPAAITTPGLTGLSFVAIADSHVMADDAAAMASNFGTATSLRSDNSPLARSFLRFDVTGVTGAITSATLRVWRLNTSPHSGFSVHDVADTTWDEVAINWNNQPAFTAAATARTGAVAAGPAYVDLDVTPLVTGNGPRSLMIDTASASSISIESREGPHKPTLILQTASTGEAPGPTVPAGVTATSAAVS